MSSLLKDLYSKEFYHNFAQILAPLLPKFNGKIFKQLLFDEAWEKRELKARMRHTTQVLKQFFPDDFGEAMSLIENLINNLRLADFKNGQLVFMFLPDYIELYGLQNYPQSIKSIEFVTQFITCEFAVRPFLKQYPAAMMEQMLQWAKHPNESVRRLASEGARPRLPWAMAVPHLKTQPNNILPILERLKDDPSETVRRSAANNLNDISKDHPDLVLNVLQNWAEPLNAQRMALLKHAARTLLKSGNPKALALFGLSTSNLIKLTHTHLQSTEIEIGQYLTLQFTLHNPSNKPFALRLEYAIYFLLANGKWNKKVFKISERQLTENETQTIQKKHLFRPITTRKYYKGQHFVGLIINGLEQVKLPFWLG